MQRIVIVGASLAGVRAAEVLREMGFAGSIELISAELDVPYDRPPLSKEVLAGTKATSEISLRPADFYQAQHIQLRLGRRAVRLDIERRVVSLDDGTAAGYDGLVIATGAQPRSLPFDAPAGVFTLRTLADSMALTRALDSAARPARVVVVGGGFIGCEVAAAARAAGAEVTIVEPQGVPLLRVLGAALGTVVREIHEANGVRFFCDQAVVGFDAGPDGRVARVNLDDGTSIPADIVVVGIGAVPATDWLADSGLTIKDGVVCDSGCFAAANIVAAGDVARWQHDVLGEIRLEHWSNAVEQGGAAARNLLAGIDSATPYTPTPYVWSDQYDLHIQFAGADGFGDDFSVVAGSLADKQFVAVAGDERIRTVIAFGRAADFTRYRRFLVRGAVLSDVLAKASAGPS